MRRWARLNGVLQLARPRTPLTLRKAAQKAAPHCLRGDEALRKCLRNRRHHRARWLRRGVYGHDSSSALRAPSSGPSTRTATVLAQGERCGGLSGITSGTSGNRR
jgi:hypothetical protein